MLKAFLTAAGILGGLFAVGAVAGAQRASAAPAAPSSGAGSSPLNVTLQDGIMGPYTLPAGGSLRLGTAAGGQVVSAVAAMGMFSVGLDMGTALVKALSSGTQDVVTVTWNYAGSSHVSTVYVQAQ